MPDVMEGCCAGEERELSDCFGCSNSNAEKDVSLDHVPGLLDFPKR
jgi:hypothetical protein